MRYSNGCLDEIFSWAGGIILLFFLFRAFPIIMISIVIVVIIYSVIKNYIDRIYGRRKEDVERIKYLELQMVRNREAFNEERKELLIKYYELEYSLKPSKKAEDLERKKKLLELDNKYEAIKNARNEEERLKKLLELNELVNDKNKPNPFDNLR